MALFNDHQNMTMSLTSPKGEHFMIENIPWDESGEELIRKFTCMMKCLTYSDGTILASLQHAAEQLKEELDCEGESYLEEKVDDFIDLRDGILKKKENYWEPEHERWYDSLKRVRRFVIENDNIIEKELTAEDLMKNSQLPFPPPNDSDNPGF